MSELTEDEQANDCTHGSATGIDTTSMSDPAKVWRCDHCGFRWRSDGVDVYATREAEELRAARWQGYRQAERESVSDPIALDRVRQEAVEAALAPIEARIRDAERTTYSPHTVYVDNLRRALAAARDAAGRS